MTEEVKNNEGIRTTLDICEIMDCLPHRYPFLLIDKVKDIVPFETATGIKNTTMNEEFFQGHFPGHPVMPGVLIVEAMAQTAGAMIIGSYPPGAGKGKLVYFMSIDGVKFRKMVVPGDILEMKVTKIKNRGAIWVFKGETYVEGKLCAEASFTAMISDAKEKDKK